MLNFKNTMKAKISEELKDEQVRLMKIRDLHPDIKSLIDAGYDENDKKGE